MMLTKSALMVAAALVLAGPAHADKFDFVALGDTAYNLPGDIPKFHALIDTINKAHPAFSIHVGDIWGLDRCNEAQYQRVHADFQRFQEPLVYTPGDNEWVDCVAPWIFDLRAKVASGKATAADKARLVPKFYDFYTGRGYDDPLARLADIRRVFFSKPLSQGAHPMPVTRQSDVSRFKKMKENVRWEYHHVMFATVNVVGSNDDFFASNQKRADETITRTRANMAWIKDAFAKAKADKDKAVVIAMQAALFDHRDSDGGLFAHPVRGGTTGSFFWIAATIAAEGGAFGKPILLINGDDHNFLVDKPFRVSHGDSKPATGDNIERLQVFGAPDLKAVTVSVDTDTPWIFGFTPLY